MDSKSRKAALKSFLAECRARLRPQDFNLPAAGRRKVPGLRREEVAELTGVSSKWYALFEAGTTDRHFSPRFVQRVAETLRLNEVERETLYQLALPDIAAAFDRVERSKAEGSLRAIAQLATFARRVSSAGTIEEAAQFAAQTLQEIIHPDCVALASMAALDGTISGYAAGPRERHWNQLSNEIVIEAHSELPRGGVGVGEYVPLVEEVAGQQSAVVPFVQRRPDGDAYDYECGLERWSKFNSRLRVRSGFATPLYHAGAFRGILAGAWTEPREFQPVEMDVLETVAALVDLAGR